MKLTLLSFATIASGTAAATPFYNQRVFGISTTSRPADSSCTDSVFSLRGGEVHESGSLDDLESHIQSAALNDKLTVIDFTAT